MLEFHCPEIQDKPWVDELLGYAQRKGCEYSFGNIYMWSPVYGNEIGRYKDFFIAKSESDENVRFPFPAGRGDYKDVIDTLIFDAAERGKICKLMGVNEENAKLLEELYPGQFELEDDRGYYDYIYNRDDLANLAGKKYHGKRNHIAYFERTFDWSYEEITSANLEECRKMNGSWERQNEDRGIDGLETELIAINRAFDNFETLNFRGGLIRVDGKVVAYTLGEKLTDDTFCVHIEKAFSDMRGAYPIINREFVRNSLQEFRYINREEDMDLEGLRKAKLSYQPEILYKKQLAYYRGANK